MLRRSTIALAMIALLSFVGGDALAKSKTKKAAAKPSVINTGDAPPKKAKKNPACHDDDGVRFVGADPSTPMAIVKDGKIREAGQPCCASWAHVGGRWKALDAHGQIVGEAEVSEAEGYDVTQCYEMAFTRTKGTDGVGLYVQGDYVAPKKSLEWAPSDAQKNALMKLVADLENALVPTPTYAETSKPAPFSDRVLYFEMPSPIDNGAPPATQRWAVVGGPLLVVARWQKDGRWVARNAEAWANESCGNERAVQPRAVFDMNGDGRPEIFIHGDECEYFGDKIFGLDTSYDARWETIATAVAGSTA